MSEVQNNISNSYDWEFFDFPITINDIHLENGFYNLNSDCIITIWRDDEYILRAKISGHIEKKTDIDYTGKSLRKGSFLEGDTIKGYSDSGTQYLISDCLIDRPSFRPGGKEKPIYFEAILLIKSVKSEIDKKAVTHRMIDWHICSTISLHFPRFTQRLDKIPPYKFRHDIDKSPDTKDIYGKTGIKNSRDHIILRLSKFIIIVESVASEYLPDWTGGIAIEYRGDLTLMPDSNMREAISEFISFIFGTQLLYVGTTQFDSDLNPIHLSSYSPWGTNVIANCSTNRIPPIPFRFNNLEEVLSGLLHNYIVNREKFKLNDVIWKLWLGKIQALGTNLPILASGLETIAEQYIDSKGLIKKYSKTEKKKYRELIEPELVILKNKLEKYQFQRFLVNKLNNPFNYGIGEKMSLFFNELGLEFDENSIESKALQARNKMSHGTFNDLSDNEYKTYKRLTNAYITLYHRIILILIGHKGYYIDYYTFGHPHLMTDENIKVEE